METNSFTLFLAGKNIKYKERKTKITNAELMHLKSHLTEESSSETMTACSHTTTHMRIGKPDLPKKRAFDKSKSPPSILNGMLMSCIYNMCLQRILGKMTEIFCMIHYHQIIKQIATPKLIFFVAFIYNKYFFRRIFSKTICPTSVTLNSWACFVLNVMR